MILTILFKKLNIFTLVEKLVVVHFVVRIVVVLVLNCHHNLLVAYIQNILAESKKKN